MPTFIRPARVVVDEGGSHLAAIIAAIVLAVVVSGAAVLIADIVAALLITAIVAVVASATVLAIVLRRTGLGIGQHPAPPDRRPLAAIPESERRAITPTPIVLHGQIVQPTFPPAERRRP